MGVYSNADFQEILERRAKGQTFPEIGEAFGKSGSAIQSALSRRLKREVENGSWREKAEAMPVREGFEYLCDIIDLCAPWINDQPAALESEPSSPDEGPWIETLTPMELRMFRILSRRPGRFYSRGQLVDLLYADRSADEIPGDKVIDVFAFKLRKKLPSSVGNLRTLWGRGHGFFPKGHKCPTGKLLSEEESEMRSEVAKEVWRKRKAS